MAFVFDVAELAPGMGKSMGIYNHARHVFEHLLPLLGPDLHMHLVCNAGCAPDFDAKGHPHVTQHIVLTDTHPGTLARQRWLRWGAQSLARRLGVRVWLSTKGFMPGWWGRSAGLRTVTVLHDLIPLWYAEHLPGRVGWLEQQVVNRSLLRTARWSDELVVISQATAHDVQRRTGRSERLHVLHNGVPLHEASPTSPMPGPYVFAVSSALPHKNTATLLAAYQAYRAQVADPLPLLVCGIDDPQQEGVTAIQGVDDRTLHTAYAHARLFVFLSRAEGFGFPPLEAMGHGTPVLCSDIEALREVTEGQATLVDPLNVAAIAQAMAQALSDPDALAAQGEQGRAVAARYRWDAVAQGLAALLRQAPLKTR